MRKICLTILLVLVVLIANITIVNADTYRGTFNLTTENTNVKVGDEVTVTLSIGNINGLKITSFAAKKVFDPTIFEYLGTTGKSGWEVKGDQTNIVLRNEAGSAEGTMAELKFKVLKEVEDTTIKLAEIDASGKEGGDFYWEDDNVNEPFVQFKVTTNTPADEPTKDPTDNPTDDPTKDPVKDPTNDNQKPSTPNTKVNNDKTTANSGSIPQTGENYMIVLLVTVATLIAVISFAKYKNTKIK